MLSKISKSLVRSVRANQVCTYYIPTNLTHLSFYSTLVLLLPEVSPILTKTKMPSERAPLIKITGKASSERCSFFLDMLMSTHINSNVVTYRVTPKEQSFQFSKAPIMKNFGELEFGEIPEPLKFVRPFRKSIIFLLSRSSCVGRSFFCFFDFYLFIINRDHNSLKWYQSCH